MTFFETGSFVLLKTYPLYWSFAFQKMRNVSESVLPRGRNFGRKPEKGPKKLCGAGKIKKGPKRGRTFLQFGFALK
jgi:hypothetical protein